MLTLTPEKCDFRNILPNAKRIGKGKTSMVFDMGETVEMYTTEWMKLDWWIHLGIIEDYDQSGYADFRGFEDRGYQNWKWHQESLLVYHCTAPKLEFVRSPRRIVNYVWKVCSRNWGKRNWIEAAWVQLYEDREYLCTLKAAEYVLGHAMVYPNDVGIDFGPGDFAMVNGILECVDPFHHVDAWKPLKMVKHPVYRRH